MTDFRPTSTLHAPRRAALLALLSFIPLVMGARGCERAVVGDECADAGSDEDCKALCEYGGKRYEPGDSFPSKDGCNSCGCGEDGEVACTKRACAPGGCEYEGKRYRTGERFPASDGCNQCSCEANGEVGCTAIGCEPVGCNYEGKHYDVGDSFPASDGCNSCSCAADGEVACTLRLCAGCEYGGRNHDVGDRFPALDGCNDCTCGDDGAVACTEKACNPTGRVCGGLAGRACPDGQYCDYAPDAQCGAADQTGSCAPIPNVCTLIYAPVCGCDDKTYGNACEAAGAGVSVAREGECDSDANARACGGIAGIACADGEFCNYPPDALCGAADQTGVCERVPDVCPEIFARVCGCDDQTYGNACEAARAGVSVVHDGECGIDPNGQACGGLLGLGCPDGQYCNYPRDALCGAADATGICTDQPSACTREYNPVCGCDGMTYGNACTAAAAGISVTSDGPCS